MVKSKPYNFCITILEKINFREKYKDTYFKIEVKYFSILFRNLEIIKSIQDDLTDSHGWFKYGRFLKLKEK